MKSRGMTIIEVAAAVVVLSLGLVPLMGAFAESASQTVGATQASVAAFLASERMEQIVAARYGSSAGYSLVTSAGFPTEPAVPGLTAYARTVTIQEVANDLLTPQPGSGVKRVTVTVSWNGGAHQVQLVRIFAEF